MRHIHLLCSIILLSGFEALAQVTHAVQAVTIPNTESRSVHSEIMNQDLNLYIKLPASYSSGKDRTFPVMYFTDANRAFPMVSNASSILEFPSPVIPEIVVVGIGYPIQDMADWAAWRTRDLTPTNDARVDKYWEERLKKSTGRQFVVRTGNASRFLECIRKELIPFVETHYRVSSTDRGLAGYSYGGLFSLYALFSSPETFSRWFAGSPSIEYDNGVLFKLEDEFAVAHRQVNARLFMSAGSLEDDETIQNMRKMADRLQLRNYTGLKLKTAVFDDEDHRSCYAAAVVRALKVLYGP